jgi:hypothetical protein
MPSLSTLLGASSLGATAIVFAACSSTRPVATVTPAESCVIGAAQHHSGDTFVLATLAPIDRANVPEPTNGAERLAFAQAYETLIDVDCDGHPRPALAASWTLDATRTRVTLSIREDARFWSGKPVTAGDVVAAWRATAEGSAPSAPVSRQIAGGSTIVDDHTLIVSLPDTAWLVLARSALAVYRPDSAVRWPEGSGPYRIADSSSDAPPGQLVLSPPATSADPQLLIRRTSSGDPRDAMDTGVDVLVTADPNAVSYAAARADLTAFPLPWTRTYALAVPGGAPRIVEVLLRPDSQSAAMRQSLARDAVHAEARPAEPPYWWSAAGACGAAPAARVAEARSNRVVYRRDDVVARGLAERLVAVHPQAVAAGLPPNEFASALSAGRDQGYVLDLPRVSLSSCRDVADLRSRAPWLASGGAADANLVPLIDSRETAILKRGRVSATVDWRGVLHFGRAGSLP